MIAVPLESTRTLLVDAPPLRVIAEVLLLVEPRIAVLLKVRVSTLAPPDTACPPLALSVLDTPRGPVTATPDVEFTTRLYAPATALSKLPTRLELPAERAPEIVAKAALRAPVRAAEAALRAPDRVQLIPPKP